MKTVVQKHVNVNYIIYCELLMIFLFLVQSMYGVSYGVGPLHHHKIYVGFILMLFTSSLKVKSFTFLVQLN